MIKNGFLINKGEYAPALCISSFFLEDVDFTLEDIDALEDYLYTINWDLLLEDDV